MHPIRHILKRLIFVLAIAALACGGILLYAHLTGGCVIRNLTGMPCPTCGMTRAGLLLFSLRFHDAFFMHPLVYVFVPLVLIVCALYVLFGIKPTDHRYTPWYIGVIVLFFAVWLVRLFFFQIP